MGGQRGFPEEETRELSENKVEKAKRGRRALSGQVPEERQKDREELKLGKSVCLGQWVQVVPRGRGNQGSDCVRQGSSGQWGATGDVKVRVDGKSCEFQRDSFSAVEKGLNGMPRNSDPEERLGRL